MDGNVVITGANRGIGFAVAQALVARGRQVTLVCRDLIAGERARRLLAAAGGDVQCVQGALDSIRSVRALVSALEQACPRVDVMIHNAGVWPRQRVLDEDGLEQAFVVNHLAPFLLNHLLEQRLAESRARVVHVSAGLYIKGKVDLVRTPRGEDFGAISTYATTKLCNLLLLDYFARRFSAHGVTVNALHPGVIRTGLGDRRDAIGLLLRLVKHFWKAPEEGARPVVHLALAAELEGTTGRYFDGVVEQPLAPAARDPQLASAVLRQAQELCGLSSLHSERDEQIHTDAR